MLEYVALAILVFVALTLFYGIIVIHDIPYEIAKHRNHPHQDVLHIAGWVSLFTFHALWPFLWIWATLYREDRGWGFSEKERGDVTDNKFWALQNRVELLEMQLVAQKKSTVEKPAQAEGNTDCVSSAAEFAIPEQGDK